MTAKVEWVECPNLTLEPFNLAAPDKRIMRSAFKFSL